MPRGRRRDGGMLTGPGDQAPAPTPAPAPSTSSDRTYTYVRELTDLRGGDTRDVWTATNLKTVTGHDGLTDLYNSRKEYQQIFGSVDNFIEYMDQMYDLQQSNPEIFNWWEVDSPAQYAANNGWPSHDGLDPLDQQQFDDEYARYTQQTLEQQFNAMVASDEYAALTAQYGLNVPVTNSDGDVFLFNGGFPVEVAEVDDNLNFGDYFLAAWAAIAFPAIAGALAAAGLSASVANIVASAAVQAITTGEIDPVQAVFSGLTDQGIDPESINASEIIQNLR